MQTAIIYWIRRDFRLSDNAALAYALQSGQPVVPVFIFDDIFQSYGAAPKWRLSLGLEKLAKSFEELGSKLVLRQGPAENILTEIIQETGATSVVWNRLYEAAARDRDSKIKEALKVRGIEAQSFAGMVMFEPWTVATAGGSYYRVYTPFWKAVRGKDVAAPLDAPKRIAVPVVWPKSDVLADWDLGSAMKRGAVIVRPYLRLGEEAAQKRLNSFIEQDVAKYHVLRDIPSLAATSGLSENLTFGEISPAQCWHAGQRALDAGALGAETFLKEVVWREFAYHLMYHTPHILNENWKPDWDAFPWNTDEAHPHVTAWKQGRTGVPFVDAAMREMYVSGRMHNRGRMIVASYLTKHLMCHWKIGQKWFEDCLVDWDPASNAMGWQWSSGSGPDATPYFRVFNADTQLQKFDPNSIYIHRWIAELSNSPPQSAQNFFDAIPKHWKLSSDMGYGEAIVTMSAGRVRALEAYQNRTF